MGVVAPERESDFAPSWRWVENERLEGRFVELRKAETANGTKVILELDSAEHGRVAVWLDAAVLRRKVTDELRRRREAGNATFEPGEQITINPGAKREGGRGSYWPFEIKFEHGIPDRSAEDLLLAEVAAEDGPSASTPSPADEDIPF